MLPASPWGAQPVSRRNSQRSSWTNPVDSSTINRSQSVLSRKSARTLPDPIQEDTKEADSKSQRTIGRAASTIGPASRPQSILKPSTPRPAAPSAVVDEDEDQPRYSYLPHPRSPVQRGESDYKCALMSCCRIRTDLS